MSTAYKVVYTKRWSKTSAGESHKQAVVVSVTQDCDTDRIHVIFQDTVYFMMISVPISKETLKRWPEELESYTP